jgi:uncharacterized protein (DUF362 family)
MFKNIVTRRGFLKVLLAGAAAIAGAGFFPRKSKAGELPASPRQKKKVRGAHDLVVASGKDPYRITVDAVDKMGGMSRFVKKGATVVVKPNIAWDRAPEYAANTNPFVVAAVVEMCFKAGASRVNVFDRTCNSEKRCYQSSGIKAAAEGKGAKVYYVDDWNYLNARFKYKSPMEGWPLYRDAIECDTFINVPVLKHHGLATLTLSMKNLMGICGGNRGSIHSDMGRKLVDITDFISPDLTVIDAFRVLTAHGPQGGDLNDVVDMNKLIVATDPALADAYAAKLAGYDPLSIPNIAEAARRGFGNSDTTSADIFELAVS